MLGNRAIDWVRIWDHMIASIQMTKKKKKKKTAFTWTMINISPWERIHNYVGIL